MRRRRVVTGAVLAPVLCLLAASCGSTGLPASGTVTITWKPAPGQSTKSVPFTGTIGGDPVQGTAVSPASLVPHLATGSTVPKSLEIGHWTGRFEGTAFTVAVTLRDFRPSSLVAGSIVADGTYGSQRIHATGTPNVHSQNLVFRGTIGKHGIEATILPSVGGHARATFTLAN